MMYRNTPPFIVACLCLAMVWPLCEPLAHAQVHELTELRRLSTAKNYSAVVKQCTEVGSKFKDSRDLPEYHMLCGLALLERFQETRDPTTLSQAIAHLEASVQNFYSPTVLIRLGEARVLSAREKVEVEERGLGEIWEGIERQMVKDKRTALLSAAAVDGLVRYVDSIAMVVLRFPDKTDLLHVLDIRLKNCWARVAITDPTSYSDSVAQKAVAAAKLYLADAALAGDLDNGDLVAGIHWLLGRRAKREYYAKPTANSRSFFLALYHLEQAAKLVRNPIERGAIHYELAELESSYETKDRDQVIKHQTRALAHANSALKQPYQDDDMVGKERQMFGDVLRALVFLHTSRNRPGDKGEVIRYAEVAYSAPFGWNGKERIFRMAAVSTDELNSKTYTLRYARRAYDIAFGKYGPGLNKAGIGAEQIANDVKLLDEFIYYLQRFGAYEQAQYYQTQVRSQFAVATAVPRVGARLPGAGRRTR